MVLTLTLLVIVEDFVDYISSAGFRGLALRRSQGGASESVVTLNGFEMQLREQIRVLLLNDALSGDASAHRIAVQVIRSGFDSLSWQERFLYFGRVSPLLRNIGEEQGSGLERQSLSQRGKPPPCDQ
jgi:hypothetical protein